MSARFAAARDEWQAVQDIVHDLIYPTSGANDD